MQKVGIAGTPSDLMAVLGDRLREVSMMRHRLGDHPNKRPRAPRSAAGVGVAAAMTLLGCMAGAGPPPAAGLDAFRSGFYAFASTSTSCGNVPRERTGAVLRELRRPGRLHRREGRWSTSPIRRTPSSSYMPGTTTAGWRPCAGPARASPAIVQQDLSSGPTPRHRQAPAAARPRQPWPT